MLCFEKYFRVLSFYSNFLWALHYTNSLWGCLACFPAVFYRPCQAHARRTHMANAPNPVLMRSFDGLSFDRRKVYIMQVVRFDL